MPNRLLKTGVAGAMLVTGLAADTYAESIGSDIVPISLGWSDAEASATDTEARGTTTTTEQETTTTEQPATTATTEAPTTTTTAPEVSLADCVAELPLEVRIGQVMMVGSHANALPGLAEVYNRHHIGGLIIMKAPDTAGTGLVADFEAAQDIDPLVATDEEGGLVQRYAEILGAVKPQYEVAQSRDPNNPQDMAELEANLTEHGRQLAAEGIEMNMSPVADVMPAGGGGPIDKDDRAFSDDPSVVSQFAATYARAWNEAGIMSVYKHPPGHGSASADSHDSPAVTPPLDEMLDRDLRPFAEMPAEATGLMVGHLETAGISQEGTPATMDPGAVQYLRDMAGPNVLFISDDLTMGAVQRPLPDAVVQTLVAGIDVPLFVGSNDPAELDTQLTEIRNRVVAAIESGELPEARLNEAATRVLGKRAVDACAAS